MKNGQQQRVQLSYTKPSAVNPDPTIYHYYTQKNKSYETNNRPTPVAAVITQEIIGRFWNTSALSFTIKRKVNPALLKYV